MNAVLLALAWVVLLTATIKWLQARSRALNEPQQCTFNGCRRVSTVSVWYRHPAGQTMIRLCERHARKWNQPPYDQDLAPGTDLGRWNRELA